MSDEEVPEVVESNPPSSEEDVKQELLKNEEWQRARQHTRFLLAVMSAIPWIGSFLAASAALSAEKEQGRINALHQSWLQEHGRKLESLGSTMQEMFERLRGLEEQVGERLEDDSYLSLVRQGFHAWDQAETEEKRALVKNLLTNAAATTLCDDDVLRLFLDWIDSYHEAHFKVIRAIYHEPGISRFEMWMDMYGEMVREDSAEADLFKLLIRDLSTGSVIRQYREKDGDGRWLKSRRPRHSTNHTMVSAFDHKQPYVLTQLGEQFVRYAMTDVIPRLGSDEPSS